MRTKPREVEAAAQGYNKALAKRGLAPFSWRRTISKEHTHGIAQKIAHRPKGRRRSFAELEAEVTLYAQEHCADASGKCARCIFRRPEEGLKDAWCYLAEGILRSSTISMCPAVRRKRAAK